jgi:hypothetical protein
MVSHSGEWTYTAVLRGDGRSIERDAMAAGGETTEERLCCKSYRGTGQV